MARRPLIGFVLVLLLAGSAEAQSRLNFPRVLPLQELRTTGFGLVNTASSPVVANFTFYGIDGQIAGSSSLSVQAGGQVAKLGSEIFTSANASGWVQVTSSSSELQGFELVGDFATVSEGTGPAAESTQLAVIDFSREDVIHIVNTASQAGTVQITLHDANGGTLDTRSVALARFQPFSLRLGDANDDDNIDLVSLSADVQISASITSKLSGGRDIAVTNAVPILGAPSDLLFPFAPIGPQGSSNWTTFIGVSNLAAASQTVSIAFTPDGGAPVTIQRTLAPRASLGDSVGRLFALSANVLTAGWLRVYGSGPLAGVVAYQDSAAGSLATVPSQSVGANRFFFGHIASLAPWYTGIALLNTNPVADYNFVARTSYSSGEFIILNRTVYSTFTTSVAGTVRYLLMLGQNTAFDQSFDTTFFPGVNTSYLVLLGSASLPVGTYTFNLTATAQGQQSMGSTSFLFTGPPAPTLNFDLFAGDAKRPDCQACTTVHNATATLLDRRPRFRVEEATIGP